ncbi:MAG: type II restriction endonuclease [Muribaculaceae bacterium]
MNKDFNLFMSQLKETNQTLDFFCDFEKIKSNVNDIKLSLCMLNSLIGSKDMRRSVETIWNRDKSAFNVLDILIAIRSNGNKLVLDKQGNIVKMNNYFESVDGIISFLIETGLKDLFESKTIKDLNDYVFGIETGLDTNARKNRSGCLMEKSIANIFSFNNIEYEQQVSSSKWNDIEKALGTDKKRFDFAIRTKSKTFLIEVNFYSIGGSKLNEVARSYSEIAPKINSVPGFEFVWITDGIGWKDARNKLQEAYLNIPKVYNLTSLKSFIDEIKTL